MQPVYHRKRLVAASSAGVATISTAVPSVVTLNTSDFDTGRRVVFYSTGDASSLTLSYTGYTENRNDTITEAVVGSTAAGIAATTITDYLSISSISLSSNANIPIIVGTSSMGGTPWHLTNWHLNPMIVGGAITFSSTANAITGRIDITYDDPTGTYPHTDNHPFNVPDVFNSTSPIGIQASTDSHGTVNVDGNTVQPFAAWRLTITSSSSSAGEVFVSVIQSGI